MTLWLLSTLASAAPTQPLQAEQPDAPAWTKAWYAQPMLNMRGISVNGRTSIQGIGGGQVGLRYAHSPWLGDHRGPPDLLGRTRVQANLLYGVTSSSFGVDIRVGSFFGPTSKYVTFQVGPDLWGNAYGTPTSTDYYLPFSMGLDIRHLLLFTITRNIGFQLGIIPGWALTRSRQIGMIGPFHELRGFVTMNVRAGNFSFRVGYQRSYNAAGVTDGLILSGGI